MNEATVLMWNAPETAPKNATVFLALEWSLDSVLVLWWVDNKGWALYPTFEVISMRLFFAGWLPFPCVGGGTMAKREYESEKIFGPNYDRNYQEAVRWSFRHYDGSELCILQKGRSLEWRKERKERPAAPRFCRGLVGWLSAHYIKEALDRSYIYLGASSNSDGVKDVDTIIIDIPIGSHPEDPISMRFSLSEILKLDMEFIEDGRDRLREHLLSLAGMIGEEGA